MHQNSQKLKVIKSIQQMDIRSVEEALQNIDQFRDYSKAEFLDKLNRTFTDLKSAGDSFLIAEFGYCDSFCQPRGKGYSFIANHSKKHFNLIFVTETNSEVEVISNIIECPNLKNYNTGFTLNVPLELGSSVKDIENNLVQDENTEIDSDDSEYYNYETDSSDTEYFNNEISEEDLLLDEHFGESAIRKKRLEDLIYEAYKYSRPLPEVLSFNELPELMDYSKLKLLKRQLKAGE